ncbi:hypothetical protein HYPSUDRAFT_214204 [Hypholoma sublateritium FD-334 SS-4]|uniref:Uncharacterized protein n=1 Tax=Hypholoma sublateritium (strain FD-334 SS-4) TaxID=945553 RepID=A0A0D2Q107_HYPSF|nr:hypothetical protein HYPSUDRAFT_214204 [Hypholoma sublateritium FD-334 SS-4]
MIMRWTHLILLAALHTAALPAAAYPPYYRSGYGEPHPEPVVPFVPPSPYYRPSPPPPVHHAPYVAPRPRRDSVPARPRRNSYVPPSMPPSQPFPHLPHPPPPPLDAFGRPAYPRTRHDSQGAARTKHPHPARSGTVDTAHLPPGFQWYADPHGAHTPYAPDGAHPAAFQPSFHGHAPVHRPPHPINAFVPPVPEVNPFLPPGHPAHATPPAPAFNPFLPPGHPGHHAPPAHPHPNHPARPVPPSARVPPALGHPLYEKYGNPNYGLPADAHIDAYKRPPHARIDPAVAKEPYEGNPLGITQPGIWGHARPGDWDGHWEGEASSARRHAADYKGKQPVRH